jgi:hypothetical protein
LSPPHRALLVDAIGALGEHIEVVVLLEKLDLDALARRLPGLADELLFEARQAASSRVPTR